MKTLKCCRVEKQAVCSSRAWDCEIGRTQLHVHGAWGTFDSSSIPYTKPPMLENIFDKNISAGGWKGHVLCFPMTLSKRVCRLRVVNCIRAIRGTEFQCLTGVRPLYKNNLGLVGDV